MKGGKRGWHEWSGQMAWRGDYDIKNVLAAVTSEPDVVIRSLISPFDSDGSSGISLKPKFDPRSAEALDQSHFDTFAFQVDSVDSADLSPGELLGIVDTQPWAEERPAERAEAA
eukprot:CAMPEP_0185572272 /NCGR_PEP_ID=MMETSP0434-20130131/4227_1 /TAXON_ID=626734 ORGANISM="Favella taraikaensis, Strain Fe Narragansett Bay" /NCGR_SAMPLE_ID=MMETSP0434 /ASSEMBLY_ACC=CAM_ASM_000379 /LENGTH=113 /DNA_ID=CAMNT_0028188079 /DNA_START=866 /DNA_END=1206 /DNA_ORIENTATION=+